MGSMHAKLAQLEVRVKIRSSRCAPTLSTKSRQSTKRRRWLLAKTEPESTREKEAKHLLNEALSSSLISHLTDHSLRTDHSLLRSV